MDLVATETLNANGVAFDSPAVRRPQRGGVPPGGLGPTNPDANDNRVVAININTAGGWAIVVWGRDGQEKKLKPLRDVNRGWIYDRVQTGETMAEMRLNPDSVSPEATMDSRTCPAHHGRALQYSWLKNCIPQRSGCLESVFHHTEH